MKFFIAILLVALATPCFGADIPYKNCATNAHLTIKSVTSSVWPPQRGQSYGLDLQGELDEDVTAGTYRMQTSFDGIQIDDQSGNLADLGISLPLAKGALRIARDAVLDQNTPSGTIGLIFSAADQNGQTIWCLDITTEIAETLADDESDADEDDSDEQLMITYGEEAMFNLQDLQDVPVPYQNCGSSADLVILQAVTSSVWPPKSGSPMTVSILANSTEDITAGTYEAKVTFDGFPILDKKGDISQFFKLPVPAGPIAVNQTFTVPSGISGVIDITVTADDQNKKELFCVGLHITL